MTDRDETAAEQRPLWRRIIDFPLVALILAIVIYAAAAGIGVFVFKTLPPMEKGLSAGVQAAVLVGLLFAAYKLAIRHLGQSPRDDLQSGDAVRNLGSGLLAGLILFSVIVAIAALTGAYRIVGCCSTAQFASDLFGPAILAGFTEELLFRGILFRWIEEFAGSWAALAVTSALFGLAHILNPNATWFSSFAIAVEAGILLGAAYMLTRSLWMPIGLHAAWNFTQGFIFDVPVSGLDQRGLVEARLSGPEILSGGQFGLEASIIAVVIATAFGLWLLSRAFRRGLIVQPMWVRRRLARPAAA